LSVFTKQVPALSKHFPRQCGSSGRPAGGAAGALLFLNAL
jgi:hypothetical protein